MNTKLYYIASIWLGILPILLISLTWIAGIYTQPPSENTFLLPYSFASAINAFFFPYALSVLWIRVVDLSGSSRKLAFLQKLWWMGFVLMALFWVMVAGIELLPDAMPILNGATVYPPLDALDKPQNLELNFISNYSASLLSTILVGLATVIQSIAVCTTIWINRNNVTQKSIRLVTFLISALTGLTGLVFLIMNGFFLSLLFYPSIFLSDIYIAGPSLSQAPKPNIWSIIAPDNWELLAVLLFLILILGLNKKFTKVSVGFGLLVVVSIVHKVYFPENSIEIEIPDKFIVMHSHSTMGGVYFGVVAILYQIILWRNQQLVIWLSYFHLAIAGIIELILVVYKPRVDIDFSFVLFLITSVSQLFILINYRLSNKAKPSAE